MSYHPLANDAGGTAADDNSERQISPKQRYETTRPRELLDAIMQSLLPPWASHGAFSCDCIDCTRLRATGAFMKGLLPTAADLDTVADQAASPVHTDVRAELLADVICE